MKQVRKISNLIAEELMAVGMNESDELFESKVSDIVSKISEAVSEAKKKEVKEEEEEIISEDADFGFIALEDTSIDGHEVLADEFIEIDEVDEDENTAVITIYDVDGYEKEEDVEVSYDALSAFMDSADVFEIEDDDADEAAGMSKGEYRKIQKMKAKKKTAKGNKKRKKNTAAQKKAIKAMLKAAHKGGAQKKALKTRKLRAKKGFYEDKSDGTASGTVKEGFDISTNGMKVSVEEGDILSMNEDGTISIVREGKTVVEGLEVSENFFDRCISEGVLEGKDCESCKEEDEHEKEVEEKKVKEEEEKVEESSILTYKSGKGYVLVKEGSEIPMGNRMRARAFLVSEGYNVKAEDLDNAADGKLVTI